MKEVDDYVIFEQHDLFDEDEYHEDDLKELDDFINSLNDEDQ